MHGRKQYFTIIVAIVGGMMGGIISSQLFMGNAVFAENKPDNELYVKYIKTQGLSLVNEAGDLRAMLGLQQPGDSPLLVMFGMGSKADGSTLVAKSDSITFSRNQKPWAELHLIQDGKPSLALFDKEGNPRAVLGTTQLKDKETGDIKTRVPSSLVLFDKRGDLLWSAP